MLKQTKKQEQKNSMALAHERTIPIRPPLVSEVSANFCGERVLRGQHIGSISYVRQIEVHTAEPLVPGPSRLEVEIAIATLEKYKSPGSDEIPVVLI
jgi:hypothetical protein